MAGAAALVDPTPTPSGLPPPSPGAPEPTSVPSGVPEPLQPVLSLLTQGLNVHAMRLDALARAVTRLERGAVQQAEAAEIARAEADRRAAEAYARAEAAEAHAEEQLKAMEARHATQQAALEKRMADMEARFEAVPPSLEELRGRYAQLEFARGNHERELTTRAAEIAEGREAHSALATRVDACAWLWAV